MILEYIFFLAYFSLNFSEINAACCYDAQIAASQFKFKESLYRAFLVNAKWPGNKIYYDVDPHLDPVIRHYVAQAIDYFNLESDTCVWWEQYYPYGLEDKAKHWVSFVQTRGVKSESIYTLTGWNLVGEINTHVYLGYKHAENRLLYGNVWLREVPWFDEVDPQGLEYLSDMLHEMMHVMGFVHEHQRRDRDCWLYVSENLIQNNPGSYKIETDGFYYSSKFPYDLNSIMHYPDQLPEFYAHKPNTTLWRADGKLSELDLGKVNYVYCDQEPWCDRYPDCYNHLYRHRFNSKCFREGPQYNTTKYTCAPCQDPG